MAPKKTRPEDVPPPPLDSLPYLQDDVYTDVVDPHSSAGQLLAAATWNGHREPLAGPSLSPQQPQTQSMTPAVDEREGAGDAVSGVIAHLELIDATLVNILVEEATEAERRRTDSRERAEKEATSNGQPIREFTEQDKLALGAELANEAVERHVEYVKNIGGSVPTLAERNALKTAVFDHMYRLGPLQPLVDAPGVENVLINGHHAQLHHPDGSMTEIPSPFESTQHLEDWVRLQAAKAPGGGREFAPVSPSLRLNLPGNIRLSVMHWTTRSPSIALRKHLHKDITLQRLVDMEVMDPRLKPILEGIVSSGASILVSGPMGAGKTTLLRALVDSLPVQTRIGTAESERELFLDEIPGREPWVVSAEILEGGGDRHPITGEKEGSFGLNDILYEFVRQQLDMVVVGEVAGPEIIPFFKAIQMAKGGMSTVHTPNIDRVIFRLVQLAMERGVSSDYATRLVAENLNIVIQLDTEWTHVSEHERVSRRYIKEIAWIEPNTDGSRAAKTTLYEGRPGGEGLFVTFPDELRANLAKVGIGPGDIPANETTRGDQ